MSFLPSSSNPFNATTQVANVQAAATGQPLPYPAGNKAQASLDKGYAVLNNNTNSDAEYKRLQALINSFRPEPIAPYFNTVANYNKARQQAEASVNPVYTKKINDFIARQQVELGRKQTDITTANTQIDQALQDALQQSGVNRTRTSEDTANNMANLANTEQNYQADTGQQFGQAIAALQGNVDKAGLTTSGLGQQQVAGATQAQNTEEQRKSDSFNMERRNQQLFKTRTFEDLTRSDELKQRQTDFGKSQNKLDLDRYIEDQKYNEGLTRAQLETQRLVDIMTNTRGYEQSGFRNFLGSLGQGNQGLALKSYGGYYA